MTIFNMNTVNGALLVFSNDQNREVVCVPFHGRRVIWVERLDESRILACSEQDGLALINADGSIAARLELPFAVNGCVRNAAGNRLFAHGWQAFAWIDCDSLSLLGDWDGIVWGDDGGRLVRLDDHASGAEPLFTPDQVACRDDDEILLTCSLPWNEEENHPALVGFGLVDPERETLAWTPVESDPAWKERDLGFVAVDPRGRHALRLDWSRLPVQAGQRKMMMGVGSAQSLSETARQEEALHRDVETPAKTYYGIPVERWTLAPAEKVQAITVRMLAYWKGKGHPNLDWMGSNEAIPFLKEMADNEADLPDLLERNRLGGGHYSERPMTVALYSLFGQADTFLWENAGPAFWVFFTDGTMRRVGEDGELSPLIRFERMIGSALHDSSLNAEDRLHDRRPDAVEVDEAGHTWFTYRAASGVIDRLRVARSFLERGDSRAIVPTSSDGYRRLKPQTDEDSLALALAGFRFACPSQDDAGCIAALDTLRGEVEKRLDSLLTVGVDHRKHLRLAFGWGDDWIPESEFFDQVIENHPGALPALSRLMEVFVAEAERRGRRGMIHGETMETPALAHGARALIALTDEKRALLLRYFNTLDYSREYYVREILTAFYAGTRGWPDRDALEFGVDWMLSDPNGDLPHMLTAGGMMEAARGMMDAEQFAELCAEKARRKFTQPGGEQDLDGAANFFGKCRWATQDDDSPFSQAVGEFFERYQTELWQGGQ